MPYRQQCGERFHDLSQAFGFQSLDISAVYHDDLEARLSLEPDLRGQLSAGNILYERRGGYKGHGAANAPFRVTARKRALGSNGMPKTWARAVAIFED